MTTDAAVTLPVGQVSDEAMRLIPEYTEKAMALQFPNGQKELTDGGNGDEVPGVQT